MFAGKFNVRTLIMSVILQVKILTFGTEWQITVRPVTHTVGKHEHIL